MPAGLSGWLTAEFARLSGGALWINSDFFFIVTSICELHTYMSVAYVQQSCACTTHIIGGYLALLGLLAAAELETFPSSNMQHLSQTLHQHTACPVDADQSTVLPTYLIMTAVAANYLVAARGNK